MVVKMVAQRQNQDQPQNISHKYQWKDNAQVYLSWGDQVMK